MKNIYLLLVGLLTIYAPKLSAQCNVNGGTLSADAIKICPNTSTYLSLNYHSGTITSWELSTNNGFSWSTVSTSSNYFLNQYFPSTGNYLYRVKVTCVYDGDVFTAYSNILTIQVTNAVAGTISGGNSSICVGTVPTKLSISGHFGDIEWQYKYNGGSYTATSCGNATSCTPSFPNGAGTYTYRAKLSCFNNQSSPAYTNEITMAVSNPTTAAICDDPNELRRSVAKVSISGIPYAFSGFLVNSLANDGRLLFLTTSHPFTRYNPNTSALASATFAWNEDLNTCSSGSATTVTSTGCTLLATDGFFTLLELTNAPNLPLLWYLGWDINATGNFSSIFQSASGIKKGKVTTTAGASAVSATISNSNDALTETSGNNVLKFTSWTAGNTEKRGRGAPLISDQKARGVYIGGPEVNCGNGPSYFADLAQAPNILNILRAGNSTATNSATVKMNYCIPYRELSGGKFDPETYKVSTYIKSTQSINDGTNIRYKAGTYVELNSGFSSGNDFIAEIDPCIINLTVIAQKTDDYIDEAVEERSDKDLISSDEWIKIYPTLIENGNSISIESTSFLDRVELKMYDIQGKHIKSFKFNGFVNEKNANVKIDDLNAGIYFIKAFDGKRFSTTKIVVR